MTFLRTALNAQRKKRGESELSTPEFIKKVRNLAGKLGIEQEMLRREAEELKKQIEQHAPELRIRAMFLRSALCSHLT